MIRLERFRLFAAKSSAIWRSPYFQEMALTAIGFAMYGVTKIAYNYFVLRGFGPKVLAVNNLSIAASFLVSILLSNLFTISMSRFAPEALGREEHDSFLFVVSFNFWLLLSCTVAAACGFQLFSGWIAAQIGASPEAIRFGSALVVLNSLYMFFKALSYVIQKVKQYAMLEILSAIAFFGMLVGCILWKRPNLLLLPFIVQFGVFALIWSVLNRHVVGNLRGVREWLKRRQQSAGMMRYSLITGLGTTGSMSLAHFFTLILGRIADAQAVAFFSSVTAALDPLNLVPRILMTVTFPRVSRLLGQGRTKELVHFTRRNFRRLTGFTFVVCLTALAMSPLLARVLFGQGAGFLVPFIRVMLIARFLPMIGVFHVSFLSGTHYPVFPNLMGPLALVVTLPILSYGLSIGGLFGVGCVVLLSSIIRTVPTLVYGESKLNMVARMPA